MQDIFSGLLIALLGATLLAVLASRYQGRDLVLLGLAYAAHVSSGFAQVLITGTLYGSGDIFGYARRGQELAAALTLNFEDMSWEVLMLLFHQEAMLPFTMSGIGSSTGSMSAIAGLIAYFTRGYVYASCVLLGVAAFFAKLCVYEVFRQTYPQPLHRRLLIANLLIPSAVFWSSGLLKEAVAIVGLGPVMLGLHRMLRGRLLSGFILLSVGSVAIGLVKAYILFAFVIAAGAWIYADRAWRGRGAQLRPVHLFIGLGVAVGGLILLGKLFPQYALESLVEQAAYYQDAGQRVRGGSTYTLVGEASEASANLQLLYAPLALLTSLYRPLIIEGTNPQLFVNALETTAFLVASGWIVYKLRFRAIYNAITQSPLAVFALVFIVTFGVAVGLTTTNLGTLSRYRVPLVPFFASLLVVLLGYQERATAPAPLPRQPGGRRLPGPARLPVGRSAT